MTTATLISPTPINAPRPAAPSAEWWRSKAATHRSKDPGLAHACRAIQCMLAGWLTTSEARRWSRRWGRFD